MPTPTPQKGSTSPEPNAAAQHYGSAAFAALAGCAGIVVGSSAPWVRVLVFSSNGVDIRPWGVVTLALGVWCGIAVAVEYLYFPAALHRVWAKPVTWAVYVSAVICCVIAATFIVRVMTSLKTSLFGVPIGMEVGWGLWLVLWAAGLVCIAAPIMLARMGRRSAGAVDKSQDAGRAFRRSGALAVFAVITIPGCVYALTNPVATDGPPPSPTASMLSRLDAGLDADLVVGGETVYAGNSVVCRQGQLPLGKSINCVIGDLHTKGAYVHLVSAGDVSQVVTVVLFGVGDVAFVYAPAISVGGPVEVVKHGTVYTISGWAENARQVSKMFEIDLAGCT